LRMSSQAPQRVSLLQRDMSLLQRFAPHPAQRTKAHTAAARTANTGVCRVSASLVYSTCIVSRVHSHTLHICASVVCVGSQKVSYLLLHGISWLFLSPYTPVSGGARAGVKLGWETWVEENLLSFRQHGDAEASAPRAHGVCV